MDQPLDLHDDDSARFLFVNGTTSARAGATFAGNINPTAGLCVIWAAKTTAEICRNPEPPFIKFFVGKLSNICMRAMMITQSDNIFAPA